MARGAVLKVSSCVIGCVAGALHVFYARRLGLLRVAGTALSDETAPLLLQKSGTDESASSAVLKHAFIWAG